MFWTSFLWLLWVGFPILASASNVVVQSLTVDLSYDEHDRLASHVLVYQDSAACRNAGVLKVEHAKIQVVALEGDALHQVFPPTSDDGNHCRAACLERGVERNLVGNIMPYMMYDHHDSFDDNAKDFVDWFQTTCATKEVCLINYHNPEAPLKVYRMNDASGTEKSFVLAIAYGERKTKCFHSVLGDTLQIEDNQDGVIKTVTIEFDSVMSFGKAQKPDLRPSFEEELEDSLEDHLIEEWERHEGIKRTFSPLGFKKGRLPNDVFASMGAFYYNNRNNKVLEEWEERELYVNWWETEVFMIPLPYDMRDRYHARLLPLVEAWAGVPVEQTVMYGMRQYESGARLLTHVDRIETHAVSLIVNIAQGNLSKPWSLEVYDHMDRLHEVTMEPGDIVYYESAKALHGRSSPMMGDGAYFVNLFTHYRPVDDPEWFDKPNPDGTPEPVMEVEGKCELISSTGTVQCDDERLGPYISSSLFFAEGAEDLIDWWWKDDPEWFDDADELDEEEDSEEDDWVDDLEVTEL